MANRHRGGRATARGAALLIALIFLVLFASMAVAIAASSGINLTIARNRVATHQAAALAETGLLLLQQNLGGMTVPATPDAEDLHEAIASHLVTAWDASSMLNTADIWSDAEGVHFPMLSVVRDDGRSGTIELTFAADGGVLSQPTISVESTGRFGNAVRTVRYQMTTQGGNYTLGAYGIASRSRIRMTGNARIQGANEDSEGSILSATYSQTRAVKLTGNARASGDVAVCNPSGQIKKTGNAKIGGDKIIGASQPTWPEVDPSVFEPYVESTLSGSTSGNKTFTNIRIPAGTNPTFSGNIKLYGVVYIEAPNNVRFTGNTKVTGVIVAEKPEVESLSANQVRFTGNMSTAGVESLPSDSRFDGLRDLTGSFLLADGYAASFTGNFNTVNGCMVASKFKLTGNAGGTIRGGIINMSDSDFRMTGNARLTIDKESAYGQPAGLKGAYVLVCVPGSYGE